MEFRQIVKARVFFTYLFWLLFDGQEKRAFKLLWLNNNFPIFTLCQGKRNYLQLYEF